MCSRKRWLAHAGTGSNRDTLAAAARAPAQRLHARSSIIPWPDYGAPVSFLAPTRRSVTNQRWNFRKRLEEQRRDAQCPTASRFDPEPMKRSPAGMPAGIRGGRPITSGTSGSMIRPMPVLYAMNSAIYVRATPRLSTLRSPKTNPNLARCNALVVQQLCPPLPAATPQQPGISASFGPSRPQHQPQRCCNRRALIRVFLTSKGPTK